MNSNVLTLSPAAFCDRFSACADGREFALKHATMAEVWDACPRADWLLWILRRVTTPDAKVMARFACWVARNTPLHDGRTTWDLLTDPRSRTAVEVAEHFLDGKATLKELKVARRDTADAAFYAADAAFHAAADAFYAAADAAAATAFYAAAAFYADAFYAADARAKARQMQADYLRTLVANPFFGISK